MSQDMITYLLLGLVFGAVVLGVLAVAPMFGRKVDMAKRLGMPGAAGAAAGGGAPTLRSDTSNNLWARLVTEVESRGISLHDDKAAVLQERLTLAGYNQPYAVRAFVLIRTTLTLIFPALTYSFLIATGSTMVGTKFYLVVLGSALLGLYLPNVIVSGRADRRMTEILNGFPDALDLMLVCVEAGQSLDQSINRVAQEMRAGYPALADEFEQVSQEVKAGKERVQVLKDLSERVGVADVSSFVTTLVQSATFGTSISEALRVYSAEMRDKRVMRAEEKANVLPTKLTLGTMMFTLPPLMLILIGPSIYSIATQLGGR